MVEFLPLTNNEERQSQQSIKVLLLLKTYYNQEAGHTTHAGEMEWEPPVQRVQEHLYSQTTPSKHLQNT